MMDQMVKERREAYVEVLEILKYMDKKYVSKIPLGLREFFERNASKEYKFYIDKSKSLEEQELKENTINILAMLNLNYWCEDEEHKQELLKKYHENDLKREEELSEKYNPDDLFRKQSSSIITKEKNNIDNLPIKNEEKNLYKKIYNIVRKFIKKFLKR